jgi:hypothetical protein
MYYKYLKYKKKYIDLIGGNEYLIQVVNELKKNKDYKNINLNLSEPIILNLDYKNNCIKIIFENKFPDFIPTFYIDNILFNLPTNISENWIIYNSNINILNELIKIIISNSSKILIFCHARIVSGTLDNLDYHWWRDKIREISCELKLSGNIIFDTVDVIKGGTYQRDGFSEDFIIEHLGEYDIVLIPDCGGKWFTLQQDKKLLDKNLSELINNNVINVLRLVKLGGAIIFSKIYDNKKCNINGKLFEDLFSAMIYFMEQNGFRTEKRYYEMYQIYYIIGFRIK